MMDKSYNENPNNVPESVIKRDVERKKEIERRKEDKCDSATEHVTYFLKTFDENKGQIETALDEAESGTMDAIKLQMLFDNVNKDLANLNKYVSNSSFFLRVYDFRRSQEILQALQQKSQEIEEKLLPKKKFGFKIRKAVNGGKINCLKNNTIDKVDGKKVNRFRFPDSHCGFTSRKGELLELAAVEVLKNDVVLANLDNCTVRICGAPSTLHITGLIRCRVLCGPVTTSVFIEGCADCTFVFACQQLRIHSTHQSHFYLHVTSRAIIEDTDCVQFAPFNWVYDGLSEHYAVSGLDITRNNWSSVDDFNWLSSDTPSPNWSVMEESNRINEWS